MQDFRFGCSKYWMHVCYAKFGLHNKVLKKIHFGFNFEINEFAIKPITSRFSLLHHRTMEIWIFQPNAAQV